MAGSPLVSLRICPKHAWSKVRKSFPYEFVKDGKVVGSKSVVYNFNLPSDVGPKMAGFGSYSNGLGVERFQAGLLENLDKKGKNDTCSSWKCLQQWSAMMFDAETGEKEGSPGSDAGVGNSPVLLQALGLAVHPEFCWQHDKATTSSIVRRNKTKLRTK
jgi:hypothetical protein